MPQKVKRTAADTGVHLLAGDSVLLPHAGGVLCLCGVEDPLRNEETHQAQLQAAQAFAKRAAAQNNAFTVLITHRPERVAEYKDGPFDLVLTGHAHGGQWRVSWLPNGFLAPDQGFFPRYTSGIYTWQHADGVTRMLVSRGLARRNTRVPRIGNPPELVLLTLE